MRLFLDSKHKPSEVNLENSKAKLLVYIPFNY